MDIGDELDRVTVEPIENPVPDEQPLEAEEVESLPDVETDLEPVPQLAHSQVAAT